MILYRNAAVLLGLSLVFGACSKPRPPVVMPAPISGMVVSDSAANKEFEVYASTPTCHALASGETLAFSVAMEKAGADKMRAMMDYWTSLPLTSEEEDEHQALQVVAEDEREAAFSETMRLKSVMQALAENVFTLYDARRFFIADNREEAQTVLRLADFLREHFHTIAPRPEKADTLPPEVLQNNVYEDVSALSEFISGNIKDEEAASWFTQKTREHMARNANYADPITAAQEIVSVRVDELRDNMPTNRAELENELHLAFKSAVTHIEGALHVPSRVKFATGPACPLKLP